MAFVERVHCDEPVKIEKSGVRHFWKSILVCDECSRNYECMYLPRHEDTSLLNFCSSACFRSSLKSGRGRAKTEQTSMHRYGTKNATQADIVKRRTRETMVKRYGVEYSMQSEVLRGKASATRVERHGDPNYNNREKSNETTTSKYGVPYAIALPEVRKKANSPEACEKRHATKKTNGSFARSLEEDRFYMLLCGVYGSENIERCVYVDGREIDFYVKCLDMYVQFDGVYWHGLDRESGKLIEGSPQQRAYLRDRQQDAWFANTDKGLVRITDIEFRKAEKSKCFDAVIAKIERK